MPSKSAISFITLLVALILTALMLHEFSEMTLIGVAVNAVLLIATRYVAKAEDRGSLLSLYLCLGSCLLVAIAVELTFARLIVFVAYGITLGVMRHYAKVEAFEMRNFAKPMTK